MNTADITSTIFILWVFATLHSFTILVTHLDVVKKNWPEYRCKPSVMPFANILGPPPDNDTMQNFTYCIKNIAQVFAGSSLNSLSGAMGSTSSSLGSAGTGFDAIGSSISSIQGNSKSNTGSTFSILGNVSMQVKRFFNSLKDTSDKGAAAGNSTTSMAGSVGDAAKGGLTNIMHAISSVP